MKHEPNGREESETARDWDPRTHEQTARDWDPRTHEQTARVGTLGPMTERAMPTAGEQRRRSPRATRGGGESGDVRAQRVEATRGGNTWRKSASSLENLNVSAQNESNETITDKKKGKLSQSEKSIGWWKRQRITEKRKSPTSRTS